MWHSGGTLWGSMAGRHWFSMDQGLFYSGFHPCGFLFDSTTICGICRQLLDWGLSSEIFCPQRTPITLANNGIKGFQLGFFSGFNTQTVSHPFVALRC